MDGLSCGCTLSVDPKPGAATVSEGREISIQFRRWEFKCPVNLLINRAFMNVLVMGTTRLTLYLIDY